MPRLSQPFKCIHVNTLTYISRTRILFKHNFHLMSQQMFNLKKLFSHFHQIHILMSQPGPVVTENAVYNAILLQILSTCFKHISMLSMIKYQVTHDNYIVLLLQFLPPEISEYLDIFSAGQVLNNVRLQKINKLRFWIISHMNSLSSI